jgi:NADH-quinone oxidoreductase subunit K
MLCPFEIIFFVLVGLFFFPFIYIGFTEPKNKNLLKLLFIIELVSLNFSLIILFTDYYYSWNTLLNCTATGQIFVLFLLTISALEASIGLAFIYTYFRFWRNINIQQLNKLKS